MGATGGGPGRCVLGLRWRSGGAEPRRAEEDPASGLSGQGWLGWLGLAWLALWLWCGWLLGFDLISVDFGWIWFDFGLYLDSRMHEHA